MFEDKRTTGKGTGVERYRAEDGIVCIDVHFESPKQLFDQRDPAPFLERDLDENFARYLFDSIRDISAAAPVKLVFLSPAESLSSMDSATIEQAIHRFFAYEAESSRRDVRLLFKQGRVALLLGLIFLVTCIGLSFFLTAGKQDWLSATIKEGLTVVGWVALWRPINLFLYEWWPVRDRERHLEKLAHAPIEFRTASLAPR